MVSPVKVDCLFEACEEHRNACEESNKKHWQRVFIDIDIHFFFLLCFYFSYFYSTYIKYLCLSTNLMKNQLRIGSVKTTHGAEVPFFPVKQASPKHKISRKSFLSTRMKTRFAKKRV
jgi:hypothetical protein